MMLIEFLLLMVLAVVLCPEVVPTARLAFILLPGNIATHGSWVHAGATIGFFGQVVACANPAAGAAVIIVLCAVAAGFAPRG